MLRGIPLMLGLVLALGVTPSHGEWRMQVHEGARVTEFLVSGIDSLTFHDAPPNAAPTASFTVTPDSGTTVTEFQFDASASTDGEDPLTALEVRWDWESDGVWDTEYSTVKTASHQYATTGRKAITLEVKDTGGLTDCSADTVLVIVGPSDYAFALTAEETVIHVSPGSYPGFFAAPFELRSYGVYDDTIFLHTSWVVQPPGWTSIPIICEEGGTCFGPQYDAPIQAGGVIDNLEVDLFVPGMGGTAVVRLTGTSLGDPTQMHSLDFTFTTEGMGRSSAAQRAEQARPAVTTGGSAGVASLAGQAR